MALRAKKLLRLKPGGPIQINDNVWFYRNPRSIDIVHAVFKNEQEYIRTDIIRISLRSILGRKSAGK